MDLVENNQYESGNEKSYLDNEKYIIKTNICKRLSKELQLPEIIYDDIGVYESPLEHGLSNSNVIIPSYYQLHKHPSKIFNIDYYEIIKDDIRNLRHLNEYQIKYIKELSHEYKNELFDIYNECIKSFNDIIR